MSSVAILTCRGWPTTTGMVAAVLNKAATLEPDGKLHYSMLLLQPKLHAFKGPRRPVRAARSLPICVHFSNNISFHRSQLLLQTGLMWEWISPVSPHFLL